MKLKYAIGILVLSLVIGVMLTRALIINLDSPPSYRRFAFGQNETYHSKFATACEQIRLQIGVVNTNEYRVAGSDFRLPMFMKKTKPTYIVTWSNRVQVVFEMAGSYGVAWDQLESDSRIWQLTLFSEAAPRVVYRRRQE